jgi:hypothetical protein
MTAPRPRKSTRFPCCAGLTAFSLFLAGCASLPSSEVLSYGVLGDVPYSELEAERLDLVIDEMNREKLAFVVHVGDIGASKDACTDAWLLRMKAQFTRIRHPFVLIPGDNEWSDCKAPLERLRRWRETFCYNETVLRLVRQQSEHCEHLRWEAGGRVFVTLNIPGDRNNVGHPEHAGRMAAVFEWLDEATAAARGRELVVLFQANPFVPRPGYEGLRRKLQSMAPLLVIHGDTHVFKEDEPLPGVRRVEVWGSPFVAWTRLPLSAPPSQ